MRVVGLDLSLTSTGVCDDEGARRLQVPLPKNATETQRARRLRDLSVLVDRACRDADLVVMEGHSFHSQNTHAHSMGELHGVVKVCLLQRGVPFVIVAPTQLKKFATGRGNADKDAVLVAAVNHGAKVNNTDCADAWWLRAMALHHYRGTASNEVRRNVLSAIRWPGLREEERLDGQAQ